MLSESYCIPRQFLYGIQFKGQEVMKDEVQCKKCGDICIIDGEFPKFFAWCDTCHDYADGFDASDYAADYMGGLIDDAYDRMKDESC
jgi:hypothetical protein